MPLILTPFRFVNFRLWCGANLVSVAGTWMQVLAANWLLLTATGSATQMGFGVLLHALPALLLGPWAGALADRVAARPLLTVTQSLHVVIALMLAMVAAYAGAAVTPWVYAATLLGGLVAAVEGPALGRFGSTMVDQDQLGPALAVSSISGSAGRIVGMSVGGILIAGVGASSVFLLNAATFLVVIFTLYRLRPLPAGVVGGLPPRDAEDTADAVSAAESVPTTALAGLRYLLRDPVVAITLGLALLLGSLGRNYQVTMAAMSAGPLHGGADGYGALSTVFAVGAVVGGLFSARAGKMYGRHLVVIGATMSILQAVSGLAPGMWAFAVMLLPIAAAAVMIDTVVATRLQLDKPLAVRGRVIAAVGTTGAIAGAAGAPVLGWLSDSLGPRAALLVAGAVTTLGCAAAAYGYAAVRRRHAAATPVFTARPLGALAMPAPVSALPARFLGDPRLPVTTEPDPVLVEPATTTDPQPVIVDPEPVDTADPEPVGAVPGQRAPREPALAPA